MFQASMLEPPQKKILTGLQVWEMVQNGTILKIPLQIIRSRRDEASEEEIDKFKVTFGLGISISVANVIKVPTV